MEVTIWNSKRMELRHWTSCDRGDSCGITNNQLTNTKQHAKQLHPARTSIVPALQCWNKTYART